MDISEFKAQNPAYKDVPDLELADALHAKYYSEIPRDQFLGHVGLSAPANDSFSTAMPRDAYQKQFLANNPQADQSALDMALGQYDKDAATRAQAATAAPADRFKVLQSPEAMFDARLNAKLQGKRNGVVPQLPAKMQPDTVHTQTPFDRLNEELRHELAVDRGEPVGPLTPSNVAPTEPGTFDTIAGNLVGGALNTLTGAGASLSRMVGANATADDWDAGRAQIAQRQHELGGDTMTGKVAGLVGGIAPALAVPADMVSQLVANAGLFAKPAFDDTLKAKLAQGYSQPLALAHAAEAFGLNLFAPTVAARGMGALAGKLGTAGLEGLGGAAAGLGQAAVEGAGFSVANSVMDKGTDVLAGQQNNNAWVNPEDMAVQALGFGALRAGHAIASGIAGHAEPLIAPTARVEDIAQAQTVDQAIAAAVESVPTINTEALRAGNDVNVADLLRSIRPLDPVPAPEPVAEPVAPEPPAAADTISAPHDLVTTGEADAPATDLPSVDGLGRSPGDIGASLSGVDGGTGLARPDAGLPAADPARLAAADGLDLSGADRPADLQPPLSETAPAEPLPPELAHGAAILSTMKPVEGMGQLQVVDPATMTGHEGSITPEHAQFVQALGDALGKKVVFFRQDGADKRLDGFAPRSAPDTLFVNVGKGDAAWHVVAGHEFFHQMPDDVRASFIATIKPMIAPEQFAALKQYINQPHLDESGHWEEIGADLFGNRFAEPGFFDKVLAQAKDRPAAAKVFAYVRSFLDKLSNAMAGKGFATDRYVADLDQIRAAAAEALGRYLKGAGAPENTIGGKPIENIGDADLSKFAKSVGTTGERARTELDRRMQTQEPASVTDEAKAMGNSRQEPMFSGERDHEALHDFKDGLTERFPDVKIDLYPNGERLNLSRIVVPKDGRGEGMGSTIMREITAYADANGKTVTLSPSADFGGSVPRLKEFYKRFGFVENKGKSRDFEISESMYREPQEAKLSGERDDDYRDEHRPPMAEDGAPLHDLTGDGNIYPADVYSKNGPRYYGTGHEADAHAFRIANMARNNPDFDVMIYRAVPKGIDAQIKAGDWVTINRAYAEDHGESRFDGDYKILSKMVKAKDIYTNGDSIQEWGYDPQDAKLSTERDTRTIEVDGERRPITDSRGKLVAQDFEGQQAFYRWFADSKVVDADGRPMVVYHGTGADFSTFDRAMSGNGQGSNLGFYFTNDRNFATSYGMRRENPSVMAAYLSIKNPRRFTTEELAQYQRKDSNEVARQQMIDDGYDGMYSPSTGVYIAFHPEQIKSATGNSGNFDGSNPDIRYSQARPDEPRYEGPGSKELYAVGPAKDSMLDSASKAWREVLMFSDPMGTGSFKAQRVASDYERALVKSNHQWNNLFRALSDHFTPDQLREMWDAGDEQNVLMQQGLPTDGRGIDRLTPDQRAVSHTIHQYGNELLAQAKAEGMFEGEGLPYWTTRMVVQIGEDGDVSKLIASGNKRPASGSPTDAIGFTKDANSLKQRKHLTTEETEAAANALVEDGKHAVVVRDLRTNVLALARLEKAIAGRRLLNQIKAEGVLSGEELVGGSGDDFVEVNHPAFTQWKPDLVKNADGKWEPKVDQNGEIDFKPTYLKIRKDWEGPLRAVLASEKDFKQVYKAYMRLKSESMNYNMASPLIHNMVILGRAAAYGKPVLTALHAYAVGRKLRTDYAAQNEMIERGMNPIGSQGFMQDITGMAAGESLVPGRSLTSQAVSRLIGAINKNAGQATARGFDKVGDFWHGTLLWDLIGDLQRGLYVHMKSAKLREGMDEISAGEFAGHFANRFAGSVRNSAMSASARQLLNVFMFSRSFTVGNLGIVKDMFQGVPSDSYSQVYTRLGAERAAALVKSGRKEAISAFVKDYGLALVSTNLIAATLIAWQQDDHKAGIKNVMGQYRDNYLTMLKMGGEHWSHWLDPWFVPDQLSLLSANEKGRTDRVRTNTEADGTAVYTRIPSGKVPEEIRNWLTKPVTTLTSKLAPIPKSIWEAATNKVGTFDQPLYPEDAHWYEKAMPMIGHVLSSQLPVSTIKAHYDILFGHESQPTNDGMMSTPERQKAAGFWTGFTTSHGYPGGPEAGLRAEVERNYREKVGLAMPAIRDAIKHGDAEKAEQLMDEADIPQKERAALRRRIEVPATGKGQSQANRKFNQHASDEERDRMDMLRQQR